jgi:hypothetical protein
MSRHVVTTNDKDFCGFPAATIPYSRQAHDKPRPRRSVQIHAALCYYRRMEQQHPHRRGLRLRHLRGTRDRSVWEVDTSDDAFEAIRDKLSGAEAQAAIGLQGLWRNGVLNGAPGSSAIALAGLAAAVAIGTTSTTSAAIATAPAGAP